MHRQTFCSGKGQKLSAGKMKKSSNKYIWKQRDIYKPMISSRPTGNTKEEYQKTEYEVTQCVRRAKLFLNYD